MYKRVLLGVSGENSVGGLELSQTCLAQVRVLAQVIDGVYYLGEFGERLW